MSSVPPPVASQPSADQALAMLELFASVGATHFDITHTHLTGQKRGFRNNRPLAEVRHSMPPLVASSVRRQNNVIVRPRATGATFVQLDDLDREKARRIAPAAFLTLETSPGNYQSWVAVKDAPLGLTTRLRRGAGADLNASGATRVAGTLNFKEKYAPAFPVVRIANAQPGKLTTVAELESLGVLAAEYQAVHTIHQTDAGMRRDYGMTAKWPSYEQVLAGAPIGPSGNPSRTSVDFTWCKLATSWGHSIEATASRLMQESTKAQENGEEYAKKTAQRAAWAAAQRNRQMPRP